MVKNNQPLQIRLTEPVIFLKGPSTGLDFRGRPQVVAADGQPAMVRGLLTLRLSKPTRIRTISIKLEGKARTEWPEGIGPRRMDTSEEHVILSEQTMFFTALRQDNSRSRSARRALSVGPGIHHGHEDEDVDADIDMPGVPGNDNDELEDWLTIGTRGRPSVVRSSSAMPGTHDSHSWHRDGFSRRPSFDDSPSTSALDIPGLSLRDRGPSPAYTPNASPPRSSVPLPGHHSRPSSRPSSLRQSNPSIPPPHEPVLSPIHSAAPSQSPSERGDSREAAVRRPIHQLSRDVSHETLQEDEVWRPDTLAQIQNGTTLSEEPTTFEAPIPPRPILEATGGRASANEVRFQEPVAADGTPVLAPPASSAQPETSDDSEARPALNTGNRTASLRTFNSGFSASSTSLSTLSQENELNERHPVNSAVQTISMASTPAHTPATSAAPSVHQRSSTETLAQPDSTSTPPAAPNDDPNPISARFPASLGLTDRRPSGTSAPHSLHRPSTENMTTTRLGRTSRTGSTSTIVEDLTPSVESSRSNLGPGASQRAASGSLASDTRRSGALHREQSDDSRGRGHHGLGAVLRSFSRDVKGKFSHHRPSSKSRTRVGSQSSSTTNPPALPHHSSSTGSVSMMTAGSNGGSAAAYDMSSRRTRDGSIAPDDFQPSFGRGGAARQGRSRERDDSLSRTRESDERSRSRARGRHKGMKVLTDKLGLGAEHEDHGEDVHNWKEFRKGTYNYPISFPIPVNAPPTIHAEFGSVVYRLKATVVRVGALTPNLVEDLEVTMIAQPQEDDLEETENVIVERQWEEQMRYQISLGGKAFPIGGTIPIGIRLMPLLKCKIHRLTVALEEKTDYFAQERKVARHETPKRFILLFVKQPDAKERIEPLLPIISDDPRAAEQSPLAELARQAALNSPPTDVIDYGAELSDQTYATLMEPLGPWHLEKDLQVPDCATKIKFSTKHDQTNIAVGHWLKVTIRVERGDDEALDSKGRRKQFDIIIETPIKILDCRVNPQWNSLPTYAAVNRNLNAVPGVCSVHSTRNGAPIGGGSARPSVADGMIAGPSGFAGPSTTSRITGLPDLPPSHSQSHSRGRDVIPTGGSGPANAGAAQGGEGGEDTLLERNIVYDRLMSGQQTETGETPPSYGEAVAMADNGISNNINQSTTIMALEDRSVSRVRGESRPGSSSRSRGRDSGRSASRTRLRD